MSRFLKASVTALAACVATSVTMNGALAGDDPPQKGHRSSQGAKKAPAKTSTKSDDNVPEISLLDAMKQGQVAVNAEGSGDGRGDAPESGSRTQFAVGFNPAGGE
jgi:hypothetical protein